MSVNHFEDLEVWKASRALRMQISKLVKDFPKDEKYRLADQLIRASRSVTNNIAKGFGRYHFQENIQFCRQARGSLYEVLDHIIIACDESYIGHNVLEGIKEQIQTIAKMLNGYIRSIQKSKSDNLYLNSQE